MNQSCVRSEPRLGAPSRSSYRAGPQTRSSAGTSTGRRVPFGLVSPKMDDHKSAYAWDARPKFDAVGSKLSRCVHSGTSTDGSASHSKLALTRADSGLPGTSVYRCALFRGMSETRATRSKDGHGRLEVMDHAPGMACICRLDDSVWLCGCLARIACTSVRSSSCTIEYPPIHPAGPRSSCDVGFVGPPSPRGSRRPWRPTPSMWHPP
jgi:hypothetical protein